MPKIANKYRSMVFLVVANVLLSIYVATDATRRKMPDARLWWVSGLFLGVAILPFYMVERPLRGGETREGGTAWNVLKYTVLAWTIAMTIGAAHYFFGFERWRLEKIITVDPVADVAVSSVLGGMLFLSIMCLLAIGLFLKEDVVEEGPTGPLAKTEKDL